MGRGLFSGEMELFERYIYALPKIEFLEKLQVSILSERRVFQPYGCNGGSPGDKGQNLLIRKRENQKGRIVNFGGKNSTVVYKGDRLRISTPGGGGWG